MNLNIKKVGVHDVKTNEKTPVFPVYSSPLQLMNQSETSQSNSASKLLWHITTPSLDSWLDSDVYLTLEGVMRLDVKVNETVAAAMPIISPGYDFSLREYFLHRMIQTANTRINEQTITEELGETLNALIQLSSSEKMRKYSTSGYKLPVYAKMSDAGSTNASAYSGLSSTGGSDQALGVGAYVNFSFCNANGDATSGTEQWLNLAYNVGSPTVANGGIVACVGGIPQTVATAAYAGQVYTIYIKFRVCERLLFEPFNGGSASDEMGFKGLKSMTIQLGLKSDLSGCFAFPKGDISNQRYLVAKPQLINNKFTEARLDYITRIPSITQPVKPVNMKPYYHIVRQNQVFSSPNIPANGTKTFRMGAFPLSQVFEYMFIFVNKTSYNYLSATPENDYFLPVSNVSLDWDGSASLLSTLTQEQLYHMSLRNGLETNWLQFSGQANQGITEGEGGAVSAPGNKVQTYGSGVLISCKDIPMSSGIGGNVSGRFVINPSITCSNVLGSAMNEDISITCLYFNRGYLVSENGRTTALLDVLTSSDVMNVNELNDVLDSEDLEMMYGGSFWSKIKSGISKVGKFLTKPAVKDIVKTGVALAAQHGNPKTKQMAQQAQEGMQLVGYGQGGQLVSGGVATGGARRGRSKKVALSSLM